MGQSQPINRLPILIIEDEPVLRIYAVGMVEQAGFEPVEAMSARDAIRILEQRPDIRIVYMDLHMPRSIRGIEIILTAASIRREDVDLPERAEFYPKPIRHEQIIATMRRMGGQLEI